MTRGLPTLAPDFYYLVKLNFKNMKILMFIVGFIMMVSFTTQEPAEYNWNKNYKVQVKDFQVDNNLGTVLARINTGICYVRNYGGTGNFKAWAVANRLQSRISPKVASGYRLKEVLDHEQIHFDIAEYVARRLNATLRGIKDPVIAENIYQQHLHLLDDIQKIYDAQTDHSNDSAWQIIWRKNIDKLLSKQDPDDNWVISPYGTEYKYKH